MKILAYIDPGTGSFVFQAVIGTMIGAAYMARQRLKNLAAKLTSGRKTEKSDKQ